MPSMITEDGEIYPIEACAVCGALCVAAELDNKHMLLHKRVGELTVQVLNLSGRYRKLIELLKPTLVELLVHKEDSHSGRTYDNGDAARAIATGV
jgi:hypothetical protein